MLKIALNFFKIFVDLVVIDLLVVVVFGKGDSLFSLPEEVVLKSRLNFRFDPGVLTELLTAPVLARLVHPILVLLQTLSHHSPRLPSFVPDLDQRIGPCSQDEGLF